VTSIGFPKKKIAKLYIKGFRKMGSIFQKELKEVMTTIEVKLFFSP
jgi:hypothetical protein